MKNIGSLVIKIFVVVFGLAAIVWGISLLRSNSSSWPSAQATIVSSRISLSGNPKDKTKYEVWYEYNVDDERHSSSFTSDSEYRPGEEITVYYDPTSPGFSITSQGEAEGLGVIGILLGLLCVGGIGWEGIKSIVANRRR